MKPLVYSRGFSRFGAGRVRGGGFVVGAMWIRRLCSTFESRVVPVLTKPTRDDSRSLWGSLLYLQNGEHARESQPPAAVEHRVEPDGSKFAPAMFWASSMDSNSLVNDREPLEPAAMTRPVPSNFRGD